MLTELCITLISYFGSKSHTWLTSLLTPQTSLTPGRRWCSYHSAIHELVAYYADAIAYQNLRLPLSYADWVLHAGGGLVRMRHEKAIHKRMMAMSTAFHISRRQLNERN